LRYILIVFIINKNLFSAVWTDSDTDLMWEIKSDFNIMKEYDWKDANQYCDNLVLNGYNDWWLPSTTQLKTLSNIDLYGEYNNGWSQWFLKNERLKNGSFFIKEKFKYNMGAEGDYWSLSDYAGRAKSEEEEAWFIDFEAGYDDYSYTNASHYVRCVRSSK